MFHLFCVLQLSSLHAQSIKPPAGRFTFVATNILVERRAGRDYSVSTDCTFFTNSHSHLSLYCYRSNQQCTYKSNVRAATRLLTGYTTGDLSLESQLRYILWTAWLVCIAAAAPTQEAFSLTPHLIPPVPSYEINSRQNPFSGNPAKSNHVHKILTNIDPNPLDFDMSQPKSNYMSMFFFRQSNKIKPHP